MTCALLCVRLTHAGENLTLTEVLNEIGERWREPLPFNYNTIACAAALITSRASLSGSKIVKTDIQYVAANFRLSSRVIHVFFGPVLCLIVSCL
jgi:hypothetical protein